MVGTHSLKMMSWRYYASRNDWYYEKDEHDETVHVHVKWNDCDDTTEIFHEYEDYDVSEYFFYDKGRWWEIHHNFHKFMAKLGVI